MQIETNSPAGLAREYTLDEAMRRVDILPPTPILVITYPLDRRTRWHPSARLGVAKQRVIETRDQKVERLILLLRGRVIG